MSSSLFNSTANSIDDISYDYIESHSINSKNYLFDTFSEEYNNPKEGKDNLSEEEFLKIFPNNNSAKDNLDLWDKRNEGKKLFETKFIGKKKRGKQTRNIKKFPHLSTDSDNLQRKIQVHFFNFIINLSNDAIKAVLGSKAYNLKLMKIDHKLKILISYDKVNNLHKSTIKDILKMKISPKNKRYSESINNDILNTVCNLSKLLEKFFDINYLVFFNDFYFNEEKETNKIIFEGIEIPFSKETKNFYHLLKKYENYKTLLIDTAKSVYFYGYDRLIRNNPFVTSKKDIELKE